jgi:hypothetical protein
MIQGKEESAEGNLKKLLNVTSFLRANINVFQSASLRAKRNLFGKYSSLE